MGAAFNSKTLEIDGQNIQLEIWDTAGSERFKSINRIYYRDATAALVVYDITKSDSLF